MKKILLSIAMLTVLGLWSNAQTIENFESISMNVFSSGINGSVDVVANPYTAGNSSMYVGKMVRGFDGDPWAGWYATMDTPVDVTANRYVHLKLWKPRISPIVFKYEGSVNSGDVNPMTPQSTVDQWEEFVFDMSVVSGEYEIIVLIPDFEDPLTLTEDIVLYFDDLYVNNDPTVGSAPVQVMENFETIPLNYMLGGSEDMSYMEMVPNLDQSGFNLSPYVIHFFRDMDGVPWGGFWSILPTEIDVTDNKYVHVKVWKPRISPVKFKIEGGVAGTLEIESMYPQTLTNAWEDMVFDFSEKTGTYPIIVFMPDYDDPVGLTEDIDIYFDDIILNNDPNPITPPSQKINVDMTESGMTQGEPVWISGALGGIHGTWEEPGTNANNEMIDLDGDGIYSITLSLPEGQVAFKFFWGMGWNNGDPAPGGDRTLTLESTMDVLYKWGIDGIVEPPTSATIQWTVNMLHQIDQGNFIEGTDYLDVAGTFNEWNGMNHQLEALGDGLYGITVPDFTVGETIEYKFRINGDWSTSEFWGGPNRTYTVAEGANEITVWYNDEPLPSAEFVFADFENTSSTLDILTVIGSGNWNNLPVSQTFMTVDNPDPNGINTSNTVMKFLRRGLNDGGEAHAGFVANETLNVTDYDYLHVMVWKPRLSPLKITCHDNFNYTYNAFNSNPQLFSHTWVDIVFDLRNFEYETFLFDFMPDHEDPLTSNELTEIYLDNFRLSNDSTPYKISINNFMAEETSICENSSISFIPDTSNVEYDSVLWVFAGGNPATSEILFPTVDYANPGTFDVKLTAWHNGLSNITSKTDYIEVIAVPDPPSMPTGPEIVCFYELTSTYYTNSELAIWELLPAEAGNINYYDSTCNIIWNESFTGEVSLKVKVYNGCGEGEYSEPVNIQKPEPSGADFDASQTLFVNQPYTVQFTNLTPNPEQYNFTWHFGNGDTSEETEPNYTYTQSGLYSISLVSAHIETGCSDTLTKADFIHCSATGISDYRQDGFRYFVNQNELKLTLLFDHQPNNYLFKLFDLNGRIICNKVINQKSTLVSLNHLPFQLYFFSIVNGNQQIVSGKFLLMN